MWKILPATMKKATGPSQSPFRCQSEQKGLHYLPETLSQWPERADLRAWPQPGIIIRIK